MKIEINKLDDFDYSFNILKLCSQNPNTEEVLSLVVTVLENWDLLCEELKAAWIDLIESVGFYPYLDKYKEKLPLSSTASKIRKEFYKSKHLETVYFHEEQKFLIDKLFNGENLIISAPTSFGKSLLIQELVASKKYSNILIIQPTLALLDETRYKMMLYSDSYKLIINTSQNPSADKGNIFMLTAERVMEYQNLPTVDLFILDEFYKLSAERDDERSDVLNNAFHLMLKNSKTQFLLLGPNIESISEGFSEHYNAEFYKTRYSLVNNEEVQYHDLFSEMKNKEKKSKKESELFELLYKLTNEQTIVYCSSPNKVRNLSKKYMLFLSEKYQGNNILPIEEWIVENIGTGWSLSDSMKYGIGIHDGAMPRHLTTSIIKYFNETKLNVLFCTTTIIEGVNTNAKNVVYFHSTKGNNVKIDYFDYSNIKGRAGRMMEHFSGKIHNFEEPPVEKKIEIDIPFFQQNPITEEVLIHLPDKEVKDKNSDSYQYLNEIESDLKRIIKRNGVSVRGQMNIIDTLFSIDNLADFQWNRYPKYEQLKLIFQLAWDNLLKPTEARRMTVNKLTYIVFKFASNQSIKKMVEGSLEYHNNDFDVAIQANYQELRHWIQYKAPKWLNVINSLQEYVCLKKSIEPGNYTHYSNILENENVDERLSFLIDYNIPSTALRKLDKKIPNTIPDDEIYAYIKNNLVENANLIDYEKDFFK